MAYNPQMPQMPQMPQQQQQMPQQQYQNPAANWQQTYQNSQWANRQPMQYQQQQMPQQMPQQYQQQQMPQFTQQQINSFLNFMRSRPMPNFMGDPRYQAQQSQQPVYQPTAQPALNPRTFVPTARYGGGASGIGAMGGFGKQVTVGDAAADAWVRAKLNEENRQKSLANGGRGVRSELEDYQRGYNEYYTGAA